ncbi:MAG TPA: flavin reductase family protein [Parafilimonas sp.]|nr:flavin reductase family protein [Parafilimonas sp.]
MHKISEPAILYFGTPVVLIGTTNENNTYNLAPMSSAFWLGWRCIIGLAASSQTTKNILRTRECVLNLPSTNQVAAVNKLACTTGANPVPESKLRKGYYYEPYKFKKAGLTYTHADLVNAPLANECPVQLEAVVSATHSLAEEDAVMKGRIMIIELRIVRVHIEESILMKGNPNKVDPNKWRPLIMSFQKFYGLGSELQYSTLSEIPEALYKTPDIEKAKRPIYKN